MNQKINDILKEIQKVVVGKDEIIEKILMAVLAGGHVLMEDVPGVGKTTTAMAFAKVRCTFHPDRDLHADDLQHTHWLLSSYRDHQRS